MERNLSENTLITNLKLGKEAAYKELFFTYFEPLTLYAKKYLGDLDTAQDVVQEVFSYLFENRESLAITESLKSFLYKSVGNRSLNLLKHEGVKDRNHSLIKHNSSEAFEEDFMELSELEVRISKLIDTLPPECARIFRMSRMEQKSNQEIADALNISKRTVETQISKALKVLRTALKMMLIQIILRNLQ